MAWADLPPSTRSWIMGFVVVVIILLILAFMGFMSGAWAKGCKNLPPTYQGSGNSRSSTPAPCVSRR